MDSTSRGLSPWPAGHNGTRETFKKVLAPSGKSPAYIHHRRIWSPRREPAAGFLNQTGGASRSLSATIRSHCAHDGAVILGFCARAGPKGNRDEKIADCRNDHSVILFAPGPSPGAGRKRCPGGGLGSGGSGTGRRGGGCVHRIYGRTFDRAFLGASAIRVAVAGVAPPGGFPARQPTCRTIRSR